MVDYGRSDAMQVGQKLWYVPSGRRGTPHEVIVTKVGRIWGYFDDQGRFDLETLRVDNGKYSSSSRLYLSKDEHEREIALEKAWTKFRQEMDLTYGVPPGVTINQIDAYDDTNTYHHSNEYGHKMRNCKACCRGRSRVKAGWPEDLAYSTPTIPANARTERRNFGKRLSPQADPTP